MAHYALLDESNIVTEVFVGKDEDTDGVDWEQYYSDVTSKVCKELHIIQFLIHTQMAEQHLEVTMQV